METFEAIKTRRSSRRFQDRPVDDDKLNTLMEAVRMSPSWASFQCWRFIIVKDRPTRERISEFTYVESFFAPLGYKANPAKKGLVGLFPLGYPIEQKKTVLPENLLVRSSFMRSGDNERL